MTQKLQQVEKIIEALIFASDKPITAFKLLEIIQSNNNTTNTEETNSLSENIISEENKPNEMSFEEVMNLNKDVESTAPTEASNSSLTENDINEAIDKLKLKYPQDTVSPIELIEVAQGFQFRTSPTYSHWLKLLNIAKPIRLSRATMETLAILAYKQPITRSEIDSIRGVDSAYTLKFLLEKKLAKILGRKDVPGKPVLYGTSNEFLSLFGLKNLSALPTLREFRELTEQHAEKVKELFEDDSLQAIKENAEPIETRTDNDDKTIAEIDEALSQARKVKSVDKILGHELFKDENEEFNDESETNFENIEQEEENIEQLTDDSSQEEDPKLFSPAPENSETNSNENNNSFAS